MPGLAGADFGALANEIVVTPRRVQKHPALELAGPVLPEALVHDREQAKSATCSPPEERERRIQYYVDADLAAL